MRPNPVPCRGALLRWRDGAACSTARKSLTQMQADARRTRGWAGGRHAGSRQILAGRPWCAVPMRWSRSHPRVLRASAFSSALDLSCLLCRAPHSAARGSIAMRPAGPHPPEAWHFRRDPAARVAADRAARLHAPIPCRPDSCRLNIPCSCCPSPILRSIAEPRAPATPPVPTENAPASRVAARTKPSRQSIGRTSPPARRVCVFLTLSVIMIDRHSPPCYTARARRNPPGKAPLPLPP